MEVEAPERSSIVERLHAAGCVAAAEEAEELIDAAQSGPQLAELIERRVTGEPLAWITGQVRFCGLRLRVDPGVYIPRWQTEPLALRAADRLPPGGMALDLCTGSGALAVVMGARVPSAAIVATDISPAAVACARANGVDARVGDLDGPVPGPWRGRVDVISAVVPYVPTDALSWLPRDVIDHEPTAALDGGPTGLHWLSAVVRLAPRWLRREGATLLLELGSDQADRLAPGLAEAGFADPEVMTDEDGDVRGIEARFPR